MVDATTLDFIRSILNYLIPIALGWFGGQYVLKKAYQKTVDVFDDITDVAKEVADVKRIVTDALYDKNVSEEEFDQIFKELDETVDVLDRLVDDGKALIEAYRELFGVIISVFRKKVG